jgi:hypothetical protein
VSVGLVFILIKFITFVLFLLKLVAETSEMHLRKQEGLGRTAYFLFTVIQVSGSTSRKKTIKQYSWEAAV